MHIVQQDSFFIDTLTMVVDSDDDSADLLIRLGEITESVVINRKNNMPLAEWRQWMRRDADYFNRRVWLFAIPVQGQHGVRGTGRICISKIRMTPRFFVDVDSYPANQGITP